MRQVGEVTYADAHKERRNIGYVSQCNKTRILCCPPAWPASLARPPARHMSSSLMIVLYKLYLCISEGPERLHEEGRRGDLRRRQQTEKK